MFSKSNNGYLYEKVCSTFDEIYKKSQDKLFRTTSLLIGINMIAGIRDGRVLPRLFVGNFLLGCGLNLHNHTMSYYINYKYYDNLRDPKFVQKLADSSNINETLANEFNKC